MMKNTLLFLILLFASINMFAQQPDDYFITTWRVPAAPANFINIPINPAFTYNYSIDWGDGSIDVAQTGNAAHTYTVAGTYTIKISGSYPHFFNGQTTQNTQLVSVEQWGNIAWQTMRGSFSYCSSLTSINARDTPDLSQVTDMARMFEFSPNFNDYIGDWDVSNVTKMEYMFYYADKFNQNLGDWDVSKVTDMTFMLFPTASLSTANYDAILNGWSSQDLRRNVTLYSSGKYCNSVAARQHLVNDLGWTIAYDSQSCTSGCAQTTIYTGTWSNGVPSNTKKAIFQANYNTTAGSIDACSIEIKPGITVTVAPNTTIRAEKDIAINGDLIFESTAAGNGELGILGINASIAGNAIVHRYMKAKRAYRMISPAVSTNTSINANWQEGVHNTSTAYGNNLNPNEGFGTHITGGTTGENGYDATRTGNPSMFTVNVATQQFEVITNTDSNRLTAGSAYLLLVRGDRSIDMNTNNPTPTETILRAKGRLSWGSQAARFTSPADNSFIMFGNPYQSSVNMQQVLATSNNVNPNHYYVYDPSLGEYGSYVTITVSDGSSEPSSAANQYLQPGQGGQVQAIAAGAVKIDFQSPYKSPGMSTSTNATGNRFPEGSLRGELYTLENFTNGGSLHDGFRISFADGYSNSLTLEDAVKPFNFYENLGSNNNGTYLSIEQRALPEAGEILPLFSSGYNYTEYVLTLELNGLEDAAFYLDDNFNGTSTLLGAGDNSYAFTIDSTNPESKASDRFAIRVAERLSVNNNNLLSAITLYPNPMVSQFTVGNPNNVQLENAAIYDITGRLIQTVDLKGATSEVTLDVSNLSNATYMVVINSENGQMSKLMVKE